MRAKVFFLWGLLLASALPTHAEASSNVDDDDPIPDDELDCNVRKLAYDYALHLQPWNAGKMRRVFDGLELHSRCRVPIPDKPLKEEAQHRVLFEDRKHVYYVDYAHGVDSNDGSKTKPVKTLLASLLLARAGGTSSMPDTAIVLREGTHFLNETIELSPQDSGLLIENFPDEEVWLSGGAVLDGKWAAVTAEAREASGMTGTNVHPDSSNTFVTTVPAANSLGMGRAAVCVRARYPNRDEHAGSMENGFTGGGGPYNDRDTLWEKPESWPPKAPAYVTVETDWWGENVSKSDFQIFNRWTYGYGGVCDMYDPPGGYMCSRDSEGGGADSDSKGPFYPGGLTFGHSVVPEDKAKAWLQDGLKGAVVHNWANGWATVGFEVTRCTNFNIEKAKGSGVRKPSYTLRWEKDGELNGGWQTGRSYGVDPGDLENPHPFQDSGATAWFVENVQSELDQDEEFFFQPDTRKLYLRPNGTSTNTLNSSSSSSSPKSPPAPGTLVVPMLETLIRIKGSNTGPSATPPPAAATPSASSTRSRSNAIVPVEDVVIKGINFRDAKSTFMRKWSAPSGGDWAIYQGGAVEVDGAVRGGIYESHMTLLDGNAIFLRGYNRNFTVANSTFDWLGATAVAALGFTTHANGAANMSGLPVGVGIDGTAGNQPRGTRMLSNMAAEVGLKQKQSAAWFQAKSCQTHIEGNIFFNFGRAEINFNDGFGGGNEITRNLMFNSCRESGGNGNFNSWDRQRFLTDVRHGPSQPSVVPADNNIHHNLVLANYQAEEGVDTDDGSSYYQIHHNVIYGGTGEKSDYQGRAKNYSNNLNIGVFMGFLTDTYYKAGLPVDVVTGNTFVQAKRCDHNLINTSHGCPFASYETCNVANLSDIPSRHGVSVRPVIQDNTVYGDGKGMLYCVNPLASDYCGIDDRQTEGTCPVIALAEFLAMPDIEETGGQRLMRGCEAKTLPANESVVVDWARKLLEF